MKKTEHVPSTGRPSSREGEPTSCDRPSPPQELPSNPPPTLPLPSSFCQRLPHPLHQSPPGTSASSLNNPAASEPLSCFTRHPEKRTHTFMCARFHIYLLVQSPLPPLAPSLAPSSCSSCCWVTVRAPIILLNLPNIHTHTQEGRQGIPEGDD